MKQTFTVKPVPKLIFGPGNIRSLPGLAAAFGSETVVLTGRKSFTDSPTWKSLASAFEQERSRCSIFRITGEPSPADIDAITGECRNHPPGCVVAIGGGSVLDAGKAVAAMLEERHPVTEYLEGVGTRQPSGNKRPFIAVPTTSGTGSEATANAVISRTGTEGFKKSLRHENYVPDIALIDPELTLTCPPSVTGACAMDCYTQLVEGYLSTNANPFTDALALDGIRRVTSALPCLIDNPHNIESRSALAYAAYLSGIVLANAGLGTVHGFASTIGGLFPIPHGIVCATLMAETNRTTLAKLLSTGENKMALDKYVTLAHIAGPDRPPIHSCDPSTFIESLETLTERLDIPTLDSYGISAEHIETIAKQTANKYNPAHLNQLELCSILTKRL